MSEKVTKVGVKREDGYLYFLDKQGDVAKVKMARGGKKGGKPSKVAKVGVKKAAGYLYFIDKQGDIRKVHTGFNGPGTGEYYDQFVSSTNDFINLLINE